VRLLEFFNSVISSLNKHNVKHLIVGGHAVNIYGYIRSTADLDLWIEKSDENLNNLYNALLSLGYDKENCSRGINEIKLNKNIGILDDDENKVDIIQLYSTKLSFQQAYSRKETVKGEITLHVISLNDLIETKLSAGRPQDIQDVNELTKHKKPE